MPHFLFEKKKLKQETVHFQLVYLEMKQETVHFLPQNLLIK